MRRAGLTALVADVADPAMERLAGALERNDVKVRRTGQGNGTTAPATLLAGVLEEDGREPADVVALGGTGLLAEAARAAQLEGRVWAVASGLPPDAELLRAVPGPIAGVAEVARWVICSHERTRGLVDARIEAVAKRTAVLPLEPAGDARACDPAVLDAATALLLDRTFPAAPWPSRPRPLRVVVAGHALHFLEAVTQWLRGLPEVELRIDQVPSFSRHDEAASREHVTWADTVVCEWASPVAAWYSCHKRPGQRLVVRLHRAELYSSWWEGIDVAAVDQVVCVSPHYARLTREITGWPADKVVVIPNYVDTTVLDRPKLACAPFVLGMMGVVPSRKRLDLAFDLLERLRAEDPRFSLHVKSRFAWEVPWAWRDPDERAAAEDAVRRARRSALLADGVVFDSYGPDVAAWLRKVGWVLSLSDDESFHLAPAEGMASGAVPLVRPWPGSETIYADEWIAGTGDGAEEPVDAVVARMATRVLDVTRDGSWERLRHEAQAQARASFDVTTVCELFGRILVEDLSAGG